MNLVTLSTSEILAGYDAVSALYPGTPSLSHWRAWEYAAYQRYQLGGRVLDLGCGDGRYFRLVWPHADNVIGVDSNSEVAKAGQDSGVYRGAHVAYADDIPEPDASFDNVFANCSLEHMDRLDRVLAEIYRCLRPGGTLLCSVVTDRFIQWSLLPKLVELAGFSEPAAALQEQFLEYHHLVNALTPEGWAARFEQAGLTPVDHLPLMPIHNGSTFLLMDAVWHFKCAHGGEMGDAMFRIFSANARFPAGFRSIFAGLLEMETDWQDGCGAVFCVRKLGGQP